MNKKIEKWKPDNFKLETNTVWNFPNRGKWATHDASYRGNWSPYIPRNLILRYSKEGNFVLDPFVGGGTTLVEGKLLNRNVIGIDINENALKICREKCDFERKKCGNVKIIKGDARKLDFIVDSSIDLICAHPPYANIINYSENIKNDLSLLEIPDFLEEMKKVAGESYRILKNGKYCAVLIGDTRKQGYVFPLSFKVMESHENAVFKLKEIIIKELHNCQKTDLWKEKSQKYNFLLLSHEYLFIYRKL